MFVTATQEQLCGRAETLLRQGRVAAARPLITVLGRMSAAQERVADLSARLAILEGRLGDATRELDAAIASLEEDGGRAAPLYRLRADVRIRGGDWVGAAADAASAVIADRSDPLSKALLGAVLMELGRFDDAIVCLDEAVTSAPQTVAYRTALAEAYARSHRPADAATILDGAIARFPRDASLRVARILLAVRQRDFEFAVDVARSACADGAADARVHGLLGHALSSIGQHEAAGTAYAEALKLAPEDPYIRHLVAASGRLPGAGRAPQEYIETVFDGYAERFEEHLIGLGYRVPGLLRRAILANGPPDGAVLDLGCGTGLMAVVLSDVARSVFAGVDRSEGMLAQAALKQQYTELHHADIVAFLRDDRRCWKLIIAADVLCYFGDLSELLAAAAERLAPGGRVALSLEEWVADEEADKGWRLAPHGRYLHTRAYLVEAAERCGLRVALLEHEALRFEGGAPVPGLIAILAHADV
jgi:predicted TPR repeat methyltransferase